MTTGLSVTMPQYLSGYGGVGWTFDDGESYIYDTLFPIMQAQRIRGTFYVITSRIGSAGYVTWEQLAALQAAGWSIGNHTRNHVHLDTLTLAEAQAEIEGGRDDLLAHGMNAANHLAYPYGGYNATVIQAAQNAGALTARSIDGGAVTISGALDLHTIKLRQNIVAQITPEMVNNYAWGSIRDKNWSLFLIHNTGSVTPEDFTAMLDWITDYRIPNITIEDLYASMSGQVTVPIGA